MAFVNLRALLEGGAREQQGQGGGGSNSGQHTFLGEQIHRFVSPFVTRTGLDDVLPFSSSLSANNGCNGNSNSNSAGGSCGIPPGAIVELYGKPSCGKTTVALSAAVEALCENFQGILEATARDELSRGQASGDAFPPAAPPTHVVWVSSTHHHPFSPSLLVNALEESAVEALEAFYDDLMRRHQHEEQQRQQRQQQADPAPLPTFSSLLLQDPSALARHVLDCGFTFYGGVDTPHRLIAACEAITMDAAEGRTADGDDANISSSSLNSHPSPPSQQRRLLVVMDCGASVLSSIEAAPLLAAVSSAEGSGMAKVGGERTQMQTAAPSTAAAGDAAADAPLTAGSAGGGAGGQQYQYTVHAIKRALHNLVAAKTFVPATASVPSGCGGMGVAMLITNLSTSSSSLFGVPNAAADLGRPYHHRPLPRPMGGAVWGSTATARVHVALVEEAGGEDGAPQRWAHVFTLLKE